MNDTDDAAPCLPRELLANTLFVLGRMGMAVKMRALAEFEEAGFSPYHYSVLALLDEGARETQATIADALKFDRSQLVGILDTLEERGFVERRRDPNDRRRHVVTLTAAGRRQLTRFRAIVERLHDDVLAPLDPAEREQLHDLLLRIAQSIDTRYVPTNTQVEDLLVPAQS